MSGRIAQLDRLYEMQLMAASYDNWKQHCELWRSEAHALQERVAALRTGMDEALGFIRSLECDCTVETGPLCGRCAFLAKGDGTHAAAEKPADREGR